MNSRKEFEHVFEKIESELGSKVLENLHIHMSGIDYSEKGEKEHLILENSDFNWRDLLEVMKKFDVKGVLINESPNLEVDARKMKEMFESN